MYKNKAENGTNNLCGQKVKKYRQMLNPKTSQSKFAEMLQVNGMDADKYTIQRIENGKRFITDIELKVIAKVLNVKYEDLLD